MKTTYEKNFQQFRIEQAREFWGTMMAYSLNCNRLRDTFFAYMPSQLTNNHVYRPWKEFELMPVCQRIRSKK